MRLPLICFALTLALAACSLKPVTLKGAIPQTGETLSGRAVFISGGGGDITFVTSRNISCEGTFNAQEAYISTGMLSCDDGRSGVFKLQEDTHTGTGTLDNQSFNLSLGR